MVTFELNNNLINLMIANYNNFKNNFIKFFDSKNFYETWKNHKL